MKIIETHFFIDKRGTQAMLFVIDLHKIYLLKKMIDL